MPQSSFNASKCASPTLIVCLLPPYLLNPRKEPTAFGTPVRLFIFSEVGSGIWSRRRVSICQPPVLVRWCPYPLLAPIPCVGAHTVCSVSTMVVAVAQCCPEMVANALGFETVYTFPRGCCLIIQLLHPSHFLPNIVNVLSLVA